MTRYSRILDAVQIPPNVVESHTPVSRLNAGSLHPSSRFARESATNTAKNWPAACFMPFVTGVSGASTPRGVAR
jgi:hypothetical protein